MGDTGFIRYILHPAVLVVKGADAAKFLHGQCTQDIKGMQPGQALRAFVLTPKGKIIGEFHALCRKPDEFYLFVAPSALDTLHNHLKKYIIIQKVEIEKRPDGLSPDELEDYRIEQGIPVFGKDFTEDNLPQETGLMECLNFNKGCYTGQEIVARLHFRGHVTKCLAWIEFEAPQFTHDEVEGLHFMAAGKRVGPMTSFRKADNGRWQGFLYLPYSFFEAPHRLIIEGTDQEVSTVKKIEIA